MEIPTNLIIKTDDIDLFHQMRKVTLEELESLKREEKVDWKKGKRKKMKKKIFIFPPI